LTKELTSREEIREKVSFSKHLIKFLVQAIKEN